MQQPAGADLQAFFDTHARRYDWRARLPYLIGFRDWAYRRRAVAALHLKDGDTVLELGCGNGRNFELLREAVGPRGAVIGVDISPAMLAGARARASRGGWGNITLVQADAAAYVPPALVDAVVATYALVAVPEYDTAIEHAAAALRPGGRIAILDQKLPAGAGRLLIPLLDLMSRPFRYSAIVGDRRLWESVRAHFGNLTLRHFYFGFVYLAVGERTPSAAPHPGE